MSWECPSTNENSIAAQGRVEGRVDHHCSHKKMAIPSGVIKHGN
jgi:hypothetical protein